MTPTKSASYIVSVHYDFEYHQMLWMVLYQFFVFLKKLRNYFKCHSSSYLSLVHFNVKVRKLYIDRSNFEKYVWNPIWYLNVQNIFIEEVDDFMCDLWMTWDQPDCVGIAGCRDMLWLLASLARLSYVINVHVWLMFYFIRKLVWHLIPSSELGNSYFVTHESW